MADNIKYPCIFLGTPPRLKASSVELADVEPSYPDNPPVPFSFMNDEVWIKVFFFIFCIY